MINGALKRRPICVLFFPPVPEARLFYLAFRAEMFLHDLVKYQYRIADIQTICKKYWKSSLLWTIIRHGIIFHDR